LGSRKPTTDGLDKGCAIEPRLAQAWAGGEFAAGAAFPRGAVALKASSLVPRRLTFREACGILGEG
jgi:hypothetical protein